MSTFQRGSLHLNWRSRKAHCFHHVIGNTQMEMALKTAGALILGFGFVDAYNKSHCCNLRVTLINPSGNVHIADLYSVAGLFAACRQRFFAGFAWKRHSARSTPPGCSGTWPRAGLRETKAFEVVSACHRARRMSARHMWTERYFLRPRSSVYPSKAFMMYRIRPRSSKT